AESIPGPLCPYDRKSTFLLCFHICDNIVLWLLDLILAVFEEHFCTRSDVQFWKFA
ncbi:hypothetical protein L9F63_017651, partial [Diploptera punctata]